LARDSELYKRYVEKLTTQESQIEKLREELARLRDAETEANNELSAYVQGLSFEK
jgi:septation ring formation regulator EzrA